MKSEGLKKIGDYEPFVQEKGVNEFAGTELKEGEVFWTVKTASGTYFDTLNQGEAIIISMLCIQEIQLKKLLKNRKT